MEILALVVLFGLALIIYKLYLIESYLRDLSSKSLIVKDLVPPFGYGDSDDSDDSGGSESHFHYPDGTFDPLRGGPDPGERFRE
jgi:hypothetical protein